MKLYQNIKDLRIARGLSQEELAERVGYTGRSMICRIESGKVDIPQSKIARFAKALGVDPVELIGFDDREEIKAEISRLFDELTFDQQKAVIQFLRSMTSK